jgi:DNA-directed RNA polymerase specialized sigma24 family protein
MQEDQKDVLLMKSDPKKLLLKYQTVFELIIRRYSRFGYYPYQDCNEVLQHLNVRLFAKVHTIMSRFDGRVLVRTYLSAICRNFIREYVRNLRKRNILQGKYYAMEPSCYLPYHNADLLIREECERLDKVMFLLGSKREKLWLLMKLIYRIRVSEQELVSLNPQAFTLISQVDLYTLNHNLKLKDKDIYMTIFPIFQNLGYGISHPDTLRKWFKQRTREVIMLMNGAPPRSAYTEDTLQILVEKYCAMSENGLYVPLVMENPPSTYEYHQTIRNLGNSAKTR